MSPHDDLSIDVSQIPPVHLELEVSRAHDLVGPYGAFVATMAPLEMAPQPRGTGGRHVHAEWRAPAPRSEWNVAAEHAVDALVVLPMAVWKRLALYGVLFLLFGNLLRCGGLSFSTNACCAMLVALGLAGVVACAQRNP